LEPDVFPIECGAPREAPGTAGLLHFCLTDPNRLEADARPRRFMVSAFYPAVDVGEPVAQLLDVFHPRREEAVGLLLQNATDEEAARLREIWPRLTVPALRQANAAPAAGGYPVLIYQPGGESSRSGVWPMAADLAAAGYVVLTTEGVRDSPAQVFPDGEIVTMPLHEGESYIWPRIADVRSLLDALAEINQEGPLAGMLDLARIGALGQSRGGYLANIAAVEDARIGAAINMDGFLWGLWTDGTGLEEYPAGFQARARSLRTPILRLTGEQPSSGQALARAGREAADFGGPFVFGALQGFGHGTFASAPYLSRNAGNALQALEAFESRRETTAVLRRILLEFFNTALMGHPCSDSLGFRDEDCFVLVRPFGPSSSG